MTQNSRQATIDLLFLSLYLDDHLSVAEDQTLTQALDSLGWEGTDSREKFLFSAFLSARSAAADAAKTEAHIASRTEIIKNEGGESEALTWLTRVLAADGLTSTEKNLISRLEKHLFP